jgi:hypothetical protein
LSAIPYGDPLRDEADQLRGVIQDELLRRARAARAAERTSGTEQK